MRAILYHFPATSPEPGTMIELDWHRDEQIFHQGDPIHTEWMRSILLGATLRIRPVRHADETHPTCGGFRLLDVDEKDPEALGKRIIDQLASLRDAGAPYATIVLCLEPEGIG